MCWYMCGPARLLWVILASYVVITIARLLGLLMAAPSHANNIGQTELIFAVDIFFHNISLQEFSKFNADTRKPHKKRLAGYYPPAHEDKSTVAYYTRHYYLVLFHDETIKKHEQKKSPYGTIPEHPKLEKYNITHITIIWGGQSKFFWGKF